MQPALELLSEGQPPYPFERLEGSTCRMAADWLALVWPNLSGLVTDLFVSSFTRLSHEICYLAAVCSLVGMAGDALRLVCSDT